MNYTETLKTLTLFYADCVRFWEREGGTHEDVIKDIERLKHDPYSPSGLLLDAEGKQAFLDYIRTI